MQYVGRAIGSVSKTWNSINPATLSGAIDVIVIEQENGDLCCSPFHVRFGKFSLLRPSQKKVDFRVNDMPTNLPMKLGEGGEAFFVFETDSAVPKALITSPVMSPTSSPDQSPATPEAMASNYQEPEFLDLSRARSESPRFRPSTPPGDVLSAGAEDQKQPALSLATPVSAPPAADLGASAVTGQSAVYADPEKHKRGSWSSTGSGSSNGGGISKEQAIERVKELTRKLTDVNIPSKISDNGDIILDINGYKSEADDFKETEEVVKRILVEELGLDYDYATGFDHDGNFRIFPKDKDDNSDDSSASTSPNLGGLLTKHNFDSDTALVAPAAAGGGATNTNTNTNTTGTDSMSIMSSDDETEEGGSHYVKTLRLTSDQLKSLNLHPGANSMSFGVNQGKAICTARMFYWSHKAPIVISDIDGTITKSDALGHVLTMIGRDWTHSGVAKLFTDIHNNGYNIMYLTARSVGQADATRSYLAGIVQNNYKLPDGPVILSPDRTIAALRREVIMKKPEIFKMACLRDIKSLYGSSEGTPFYAGFGNRITDALSYRSVGVPPSKIFTINTNSEVHMELLELAGYKSSYVYIADLVDHFFPHVIEYGDNIPGKSEYTDVNFWREPLPDISDLSDVDNDENEDTASSLPAGGSKSASGSPLLHNNGMFDSSAHGSSQDAPGSKRNSHVDFENQDYLGDEDEDDDYEEYDEDEDYDSEYDDDEEPEENDYEADLESEDLDGEDVESEDLDGELLAEQGISINPKDSSVAPQQLTHLAGGSSPKITKATEMLQNLALGEGK